jgi:hypothetical protein
MEFVLNVARKVEWMITTFGSDKHLRGSAMRVAVVSTGPLGSLTPCSDDLFVVLF